MWCSRSLASTSARVNCEPTSGRSGLSRSRYALPPTFSPCPCVTTTPPVAVGDGRRARLPPALLVPREQHPAAPHEQPAGMLEPRHVPADLTQSPERDPPQAVGGQRRRRAELRMRMTHANTSLAPAVP